MRVHFDRRNAVRCCIVLVAESERKKVQPTDAVRGLASARSSIESRLNGCRDVSA